MRGPLFQPVKIESWVQFLSTFGGYIAQGYLAYSVYGFFANGGRTCWVSRVADPRTARQATLEMGSIKISAGTEGSWGNGIYVRPSLRGNELVVLSVHLPDGQEQFLRAPFITSPGQPDNLFDLPQNEIDPKQSLSPIVVLEPSEPAVRAPAEGFLRSGSDGLADLEPRHFAQAFDALAEINEIGIVTAPDLMPKLPITPKFKTTPNCCDNSGVPTPLPDSSDVPEFPPPFSDNQIQDLQMALANSAATLRYRFAVLDGAAERAQPTEVIRWRNNLFRTSFAGLYYPWILVDDPLRLTGLVRAVPPSGHIAGIFAQCDQRAGPQKPPMNEVLEGVSDVRFLVDHTDAGELNDNNVNAIRIMPGRGVRIMGARTLWSENLLFRYINVRRLISAIEKSLEQSLNWTVFEPNNPQLWSEVDRTVRSFLEDLFRRGVLDGATSEEAYSVRCDEHTNPPSETDLGRMICEVGVKPPYPAEFVVVTLGISKDGIQIREAREHSA
jgi:hypothetical protein